MPVMPIVFSALGVLILLILVIGGFLMLSLGIIGHYIARIYEEVKGRPKYIISRTTEEAAGKEAQNGKENLCRTGS